MNLHNKTGFQAGFIISLCYTSYMTTKEKINSDLKQALLNRDSFRTTLMRGLKSAILYEEVARGLRNEGLPEEDIIRILEKEAKKRAESAQLFLQGGNSDKYRQELLEKEIIEGYLPDKLTGDELNDLLKGILQQNSDEKNLGVLIGKVKQAAGGKLTDSAEIVEAIKRIRE